MSGAFNIDIEVEQSGSSKIKIYCASLTNTWDVEHNTSELMRFHAALSKDPAIIKNKIGVGQCPKISDIGTCELFLSRLGCTSSVLRIKLFHDFLKIPEQVREGLTYASHKAFGKNIREGYMQKHPRFVRRGGGRKWIRLTKEEKGGSLVCYKDDNKNGIIASIKIGASTIVQNLIDKGIPNAFVVKSGKRQWVLQASNQRDYTIWQTQLDNMLKQFGHKVTGGTMNEEQKEDVLDSGGNTQVDKLTKQNMELKNESVMLQARMDGMQKDLDRLKVLGDEAGSGHEVLTKKVETEFRLQRDALIRDYELQSQNLESELNELRRQIDAKTAMDSGTGAGLLKGFELGGEEVLKSEIDTEKRILDEFTEDERLTIKFMHNHLHRHRHKHVHTHKHIHLHKDAADNVNNVDIGDMELINKHTITHTITHSNTQFQIKKSFW